jgi:hypothetical protein
MRDLMVVMWESVVVWDGIVTWLWGGTMGWLHLDMLLFWCL